MEKKTVSEQKVLLQFLGESHDKNQLIVEVDDLNIYILNDTRIFWIYDKTKPGILSGFMHRNKMSEELVIQAAPHDLVQLKEFLRQRVFQAQFQDQYDVIQQIGKGNYARVYSVKNKFTEKQYAVKCFDKEKLKTIEKGITSLYNEIRVMRLLKNHQSITNLQEIFQGEGTYYFVLELVDGGTLYELIKQNSVTGFRSQQTQRITKALLEGIKHMADHNIMHRDLKPENILMTKDNGIKIADFGLSTVASEFPYFFPQCGTPGFVAPEIANLTEKTTGYDVICDVFSIGVIFHILLTGEAVFPGNQFNEVLKKNKACEINFETSHFDFVDEQAKDLLKLMLQKDPMNRITSYDALQHPYFKDKKSAMVRSSSQEQFHVAGTDSSIKQGQDDEDDDEDQEPKMRSQNTTLFTQPLKIPYLTQQDDSKAEIQSFFNQEVNAQKLDQISSISGKICGNSLGNSHIISFQGQQLQFGLQEKQETPKKPYE